MGFSLGRIEVGWVLDLAISTESHNFLGFNVYFQVLFYCHRNAVFYVHH